MDKAFTVEDKTRRWEYHREIKNLMGRYMFSLLTLREAHIFNDFWAKAHADICLGFNDGWYVGRESIEAYYRAWDESNQAADGKMKAMFPEKLGEGKELIYGAGPYNSKPVSTCVIEIAGDEKTAKGIWYSRGSKVLLTEAGTVSYWTWGMYAVDFVLEDGAWRLWHMMYLEDICVPGGQSWGKPIQNYPAVASFENAAALYQDIPAPDVPERLWESYSPDRPFRKFPDFPKPYDSFEETFSYGYKKEA